MGHPVPPCAQKRGDSHLDHHRCRHSTLFLGSLLGESFFNIPGLGSYLRDAIDSQDFAVVRAMVFLGAITTIIGYLLTDISYTLVDPRVRLE